MNPYQTYCDEWGVSSVLNGKLELPTAKETVLHFFESLQKSAPGMTEFEKRDNGEYVLEEDREGGSYRWTTVDAKRLAMGFVAPPSAELADEHILRVLDLSTYHLDLGRMTTEFLDATYYFEFLYQGNHDEVVAQALAEGSPFEDLTQYPGGKVLNYQPSLLIALDDGCQLQARINVETRTSAYQVRTGTFPEVPISVFLTVRQFWGKNSPKSFEESYRHQRTILDELAQTYVQPKILRPLQHVIATK
jgi:hypothetical protein